MRYAALSAPIACSLALHVAVLNFGWEIFASDAGVSAPWRKPALRARLAAAPSPPAAVPALPPQPKPAEKPVMRSEPKAQPQPAPALVPPSAPDSGPVADMQPVQAPSTDLPDSAFLDQGGVDQLARPLIEPEYDGSLSAFRQVIEFDLLIDASGKVVRVANVSEGPPREVVGAVLAAFFTIPYEPAKLAGQPVAVRQRFAVQPQAPALLPSVAGAYKGGGSPCAAAC